MTHEISSQKKNEYLEAFKIFDRNNDGQITQDELKLLLNNIDILII